MENILFFLALSAYIIGTLLYATYAFSRKDVLSSGARRVLTVAVLAHIGSLFFRAWTAQSITSYGMYVPWSNWFECFSFFALIITVEFLFVQLFHPSPFIGVFIAPFALVSLGVALVSPQGRLIPEMNSDLQSVWMAIHVPLMFIAYGGFINAFGMGLAYFVQERQLKSRKPTEMSFHLPSLEDLENMNVRLIGGFFPVLTLGILVGFLWAKESWGHFWVWDAKLIWSLLTWIIFSVYLYLRVIAGWRGRKIVFLSLVGTAIMIFTFVGVNYFSSVHGYLTGR